MAEDNVTPIMPDLVNDGSAERDHLLGYSGSIGGTPVEEALEEQRNALFGAQAIIKMAAAALQHHFGGDWPAGVPMFSLALENVAKTLDDVAGALEAYSLEERALEIASAKSADVQQ
jgi:hypothetical protein